MTTIAVIDYGMGNLHSMAKALERVAPDQRVVVSYDPAELSRADRLVFPGVGGIRHCMDEIRRLHLDDVVLEAVQTKPVLAVCVGLQALMKHSEENDGVECIGLLPGRVRRFQGEQLTVPHMGWNQVEFSGEHPLWAGIESGERFYFVHSYYVDAANPDQVRGLSHYPKPFACALAQQNLFAVQFHPEKSQHAGLKLLSNFCQWDGTTP